MRTEIIHQPPAADGAAIGTTGHHDFRRVAGALPPLDDCGVVINVRSAVVMPELFLEGLTVARNLHPGKPGRFTACKLDMQAHYRTRVNVVETPRATAAAAASTSPATTRSWCRCCRGRWWSGCKARASVRRGTRREAAAGSIPGGVEPGRGCGETFRRASKIPSS